ncbi:hypothetical protein [Paraburkholderia bannensis]|uniref:hypothetical protein n=1 Tax=Paraburkholderia bannensis TaxID=765414 RepID=UPI002AC3595E|nr:hypothetical protein [Paraburkholderia bannensis]
MNRNGVYEILPQIGVADIKFGMSAGDVENLWGAPSRKSKIFLAISQRFVMEHWLRTTKMTATWQRLVSSLYSNIVVKGLTIFRKHHDQASMNFQKLDADVYEGDGFIVSNTLGIGLFGFRCDDFKAIMLTVLKRG